MAIAHLEQDPQRVSSEIPRYGRYLPKPLGLPLTEGVLEEVHLRSELTPGFSYAIFNMDIPVGPALRAVFEQVRERDEEGRSLRKVLRGAVVGERLAVSFDLKHPLALANLLRKAELNAQAPKNSSAVAFEVREESPSDRLEVRFSYHGKGKNKERVLKSVRKKLGKVYKKPARHLKGVARVERFLDDNLPPNSWREEERTLYALV